MEQACITIKTEPKFKQDCDELFSKYGITTDMAVKLFLNKALAEKSLPKKFLEDLEESAVKIICDLPEAGRRNEKTGTYVLPKEWDDEADEIYDRPA